MNTNRLLMVLLMLGLLVLTFGLPSTVFASELLDEDVMTVKFEGGLVNKVSLMDGTGKVIVDYTKFIITTDTEIIEDNGMLDTGATVNVEAVRHHGMLLATKIVVLADTTDTVRFDGGKICLVDLGAYKVIVDGTKFIVNADTVLPEDGLMKGDIVRVEAERMDGKLIATKISLIN